MTIILDILKNKKTTGEILSQIKSFIIMIVVGGIIYIILSELALAIYGTTLSDYSGASKVGIESLLRLPNSIYITYLTFYEYYFKDTILKNDYWNRDYINLMLIVLNIIIGVTLIIKNKVYKDKKKLFILIISCFLLPVCCASIELIAPERYITLLMAASYIFPVIFGILCLDLFDKNEDTLIKENAINLLKWVTITVTTILISTYIFSDNASYMAVKRSYNQTYSYAIRIIDRIETNEEYVEGMPLLFAGTINSENYSRSSKIYEMTNGFIFDNDVCWESYSGSRGTWEKFLTNYLGIKIKWCTKEEYKTIIATEEFKNMGIFPNEDSVKVINNIMVVKLTENPAMP